MELEPVIGLEIHVALKTKSKMFCSCVNVSFKNAAPNSSICPICMGYPGTLPVANKIAIEWVQRAGAALNCTLANHSKFDRKHYFYPDLPKGYQISQYDEPFCLTGMLAIIVDGKTRVIGLDRIHLEEDAAKNLHPAGTNYTLIDYNRAGTPLLEIVTKPDLNSPAEARVFLQELQQIMRALDISDADMEKGQLRCDANISLRPALVKTAAGASSGILYPKTEIKNINSFKFVEKALAYEIARQTKLWETGLAPAQPSTRGYNATKNVTYEQRAKEAAADYRYFPEPDIPPFEFTEDELRRIELSVPELPLAKQTRLMNQLGISAHQSQLFLERPDLSEFYENTVSEILQLDNEQAQISPTDILALKQLAANIVLRQVRQMFSPLASSRETRGQKRDQSSISRISPANFAELVVLVYQGKINKEALNPVLKEMQRTGGDPDHIIHNLGLEQMAGGDELNQIVAEVIQENPDIVAKIVAGKSSAIQALVGQVMRKTKGQAKVTEVTKLLGHMLSL